MRSRICNRRVTGLLALLVMIHGAAVLPAAAAATGDDTARAKAKLKSGARALDDGDYELALSSFQEAFQIIPSPKIYFNFGLAYSGLARHADALEAFERFISEAHDASAETRADAEHRIASLRKRVGTLSIVCDTAGAEVRIDGKNVGNTPLDKKVYVQAGAHQLVVRHQDGAPFVRDFTAVAGRDLQLSAKLIVPVPVSDAPPQGRGDKPAPPTLIDRPNTEPVAEKPSGTNWLIWGVAGGVAVAAAVALVVVLGRPTSYPNPDGRILGN